MSKNLLKSAIVYKAELPNIELMRQHLAELPLTEIGDHELVRVGFVNNERTAELVTPLVEGLGYSFSLQIDEKSIPGSTVKREVAKRAAAIEESQARKVGSKERAGLKEEVMFEFAERALVTSTVVNAYYSEADNLLMVDAAVSKADRLIGALVQCVGSITTHTINISDMKNGLTTRTRKWLEGDSEIFGSLLPGHYCRLIRQLEDKETILHTGVDLSSISGDLLSQLDEGFRVDRLAFRYRDMLEFRLTEKFHFKSIECAPYEPKDEDDAAYIWRQEASVRTFAMAKCINELCALLEYKQPEPKQEDAA